MRHQRKSRRFGMSPSHRKSMFRNMVTSLFVHERIRTTLDRAKELRRVAEKLITLSKRGNLSARRLAARTLRTEGVKEGLRTVQKETALKKLFDTLAPRYTDRPGGYTRIIKLGRRLGDNACLALLEMLPEEPKGSTTKTTKKKSTSKTPKTTTKAKSAALKAKQTKSQATSSTATKKVSKKKAVKKAKPEAEAKEPKETKE